MPCNETQKEGNPTKSQAVNNLIKQIEKHEVRGTGVASAACHLFKWDEYIMLLIAAWLVFSHCKKAMYMILVVMLLQWHLIGHIDNIICMVTTTIQQNLHCPSYLQLKMCKWKNIRSKQDMPLQTFFVLCNNGSISMPCSESCCLR
jgi:hypothetical protein